MSDHPRATEDNPPAPGAALLSAVGSMKPVRTRVPARTVAALVGVALIAPVVALIVNGPRKDLAFLPTAWVVIMAVSWAAAAAVTLFAALVPRRGEVLPDTIRAARAAVGAAVALLALGLFATVDAAGYTIVTGTAFDGAWRHCVGFSLKVTLPVLLVSLFLLRRCFPIGGAKVAAAIGAGAGALAGLGLHFICHFGGGLHVGLAHAGGVVLGAVLGVLLLPRFLE